MPDAEANGLMYASALHRSETLLNALGIKTGSWPAWPRWEI